MLKSCYTICMTFKTMRRKKNLEQKTREKSPSNSRPKASNNRGQNGEISREELDELNKELDEVLARYYPEA